MRREHRHPGRRELQFPVARGAVCLGQAMRVSSFVTDDHWFLLPSGKRTIPRFPPATGKMPKSWSDTLVWPSGRAFPDVSSAQ